MFQCLSKGWRSTSRVIGLLPLRAFSQSVAPRISSVKKLPDWNLGTFREQASNKNIPAQLSISESALPPACQKWFIHNSSLSPADATTNTSRTQTTSELRKSFWSEHEATIVPLELTSTTSQPLNEHGDLPVSTTTQFHRTSATLKILLTYLSTPLAPNTTTSLALQEQHSIYLAQCDLSSLPASLQADIPTPDLVTQSGRGDIYSSSLWMGRPPTYTPLHRDPNPNLFLQIAGQKIVRLLPPEIGGAVFDHVQYQLASERSKPGSGGAASASFRGEEMMAGPEMEMLHRIVWAETPDGNDGVLQYACEAKLGMGDALFIPKGWWHSVKGVGEGVTASVNWWFR